MPRIRAILSEKLGLNDTAIRQLIDTNPRTVIGQADS